MRKELFKDRNGWVDPKRQERAEASLTVDPAHAKKKAFEERKHNVRFLWNRLWEDIVTQLTWFVLMLIVAICSFVMFARTEVAAFLFVTIFVTAVLLVELPCAGFALFLRIMKIREETDGGNKVIISTYKRKD